MPARRRAAIALTSQHQFKAEMDDEPGATCSRKRQNCRLKIRDTKMPPAKERQMPMGPVEYIPPAIERSFGWLRAVPILSRLMSHALTALKKAAIRVRLGVIATAGTYVKGQVAFYYKDDHSYRAIPKSTPTETSASLMSPSIISGSAAKIQQRVSDRTSASHRTRRHRR